MANKALEVKKIENKWFVLDRGCAVTIAPSKTQAERFVAMNLIETTKNPWGIVQRLFDRMCEAFISCDETNDKEVFWTWENRMLEEFPQLCKITAYDSWKWTAHLVGNGWYGKVSLVEDNGQLKCYPTLYAF